MTRALPKNQLKGWNTGFTQPDKPGVYQRSTSGLDKVYSVWNGQVWSRTYETPEKALAMEFHPSSSQTMHWKEIK